MVPGSTGPGQLFLYLRVLHVLFVNDVFFEVEQASNEGSGQCRRLNCGETTTERIWTEDAEVAAISREEGLQVFVNADGSTKYFHSPRRRLVTSSG